MATIYNQPHRGAKGGYYTRTLVKELRSKTIVNPEIKCLFTLDEEDDGEILSLPKLFLRFYYDPTETCFIDYAFGGDVAHWETFKSCTSINKFYKIWKKRAEQRLLSESMTKIMEIACDQNDRSRFSALKYLADRGFKIGNETPKASVGRPKKAKDDSFVDEKEYLEDLARLRSE